MKQTRTVIILAAVYMLLAMVGPAYSLPVLQLDVEGGTYNADPEIESVMAPAGEFTLYTLLTPPENSTGDEIQALLEDYWLSVALRPKVEENMNDGIDFGSFQLNGTTFQTQDMIFGTPPGEFLESDPEIVAKHGVFDTYYMQFSFDFDALLTTTKYNVQDDPGGVSPSATGEAYYMAFDINASGIDAPYTLHFDLYNEDIFAPFSHDVDSTVPEPGTMFLLGTALAGLAIFRRRGSNINSSHHGETRGIQSSPA